MGTDLGEPKQLSAWVVGVRAAVDEDPRRCLYPFHDKRVGHPRLGGDVGLHRGNHVANVFIRRYRSTKKILFDGIKKTCKTGRRNEAHRSGPKLRAEVPVLKHTVLVARQSCVSGEKSIGAEVHADNQSHGGEYSNWLKRMTVARRVPTLLPERHPDDGGGHRDGPHAGASVHLADEEMSEVVRGYILVAERPLTGPLERSPEGHAAEGAPG